MKKLGYNVIFYLERPKGMLTNISQCNKDVFCLSLLRKNDIINLTNKLITLSCHEEKIMKMQLIIEEVCNKNWATIKSKVLSLRNEVKEAHINILGSNFYEIRYHNERDNKET